MTEPEGDGDFTLWPTDCGRSLRDGLSSAAPMEPQASPPEASIPSAWPEVEWEEGYPIAENDDFAAWDGLPLDFRQAADFLLRELPAAAENCCAWCEVTDATDELFKDKPVKRIEFSTGGWSGAESLVGFIEGRFDTRHFMLSWRRGGHYVFEIPAHFFASGIEAGTAATEETGAVHESPPGRPDEPRKKLTPKYTPEVPMEDREEPGEWR